MNRISFASHVGYGSVTRAIRTKLSQLTHGRTNILMVIPAVNQYMCEAFIIHEKFGLRLDVVGLRDS